VIGVGAGQGAEPEAPVGKVPHTIFIEAEAVGAATTNSKNWSVKELDGASGGKVLKLRGLMSIGGVTIPEPGAYRIWVRYFRATVKPSRFSRFFVLLRDEEGEELAFHFCDWAPVRLPTEKPYEPFVPWAGERTGFVWEPFEAMFERPVKGELLISGGQVDCLIITTSTDFNPDVVDAAGLALMAAAPVPALAERPASPGLVWSKGLPAHVDDFAGVADPAERFMAGLINCSSYFLDTARQVRMGFNRDHTLATRESTRHGVLTQAHPQCYEGGRELSKLYASPTGRFVNVEGQVSSIFSLSFPPVAESSAAQLAINVRRYFDDPLEAAYANVRLCHEVGGYLDYSPYAQTAFRKWLEAKHGSIGRLNERWGTSYETFDVIVPPPAFSNGPAAWLEFRAYSGRQFAEAVARQVPTIRKLDKRQRNLACSLSNLDFVSPYFSRMRPIDFDEFNTVVMAGERFNFWDTYCADDQLGAEVDFVASVAEGQRPVIQEWSNHVNEPRIAARSYWTAVSKGVAGIFLFMFQEGIRHESYPKWALLSHDRSPKAKLAAYSDAVQEVHRLEPLLMAARPVHAVKPVAIYWSRIDLSLAQPHESLYGTAINSPIHVYRTLRSLGYPVRWITPRQVEAGALDQVGALVLPGCDHIPRASAERIAAWVKAGGVAIGDQWPGAWDEYARPQTVLGPLFGVRAVPKASGAKTGMLAVQESTQGYGEVTDAAVGRKEYFTMIDEVAQQPGATHPVAVALGDYMVSGIGPEKVVCVSGHVIGMEHRGAAGFVVNTCGKGQTLYSAMMLGTIYESGGTRFEWDSTHSGLAYGRILDEFLKFADVKPSSTVSGLAPRVTAKLRVESPLVTPEGNLLVGLTSLNDDVVGPFDLSVELPAATCGPFARVFVATQGSRRLQPVEVKLQGTRMTLRMPQFDTHAMIVALKDSGPLVSLELKDVTRGVADLAVIGTNQEFKIEAVVFNPSSKALPAGELTLSVPAGWLQSAEGMPVSAIAPGSEARMMFTVRAPELAAAKRIHPILTRYRSGNIQSTPTTEMVWWGWGAN